MHRVSRLFIPILILALWTGCSGEDGSSPEENPEPFDGIVFPEGFLWGVASASWQAEGHTTPEGRRYDSNWTQWEQMGRISDGQTNERGSGWYENYEQEIRLAAETGVNAMRISLAWERIEPWEGVFDQPAIDRYVDMADIMLAYGITPMITLYHWTLPTWLEAPIENRPGFGTKDLRAVEAFERFVRHVVPFLKDRVDLYCTINESATISAQGYLTGTFPPGRVANLQGYLASYFNLLFAHAAAFHAIKELDDADADGDGQTSRVGFALVCAWNFPYDPENPRDQVAADSWNYISTLSWIEPLFTGYIDVDMDAEYVGRWFYPTEGFYPELLGALDWIGINYYGPQYAKGGLLWWLPPIHGIPSFSPETDPPGTVHSEFGTVIDVSGLETVLEYMGTLGFPLYITENGCADADDNQRPRYLVEHLYKTGEAVAKGIDVGGYFYWTLSDNFEWNHGINARFGLYTVDFDRADMPRYPTNSASLYRTIAIENRISRDLYEQMVSVPYPED